MVDNMKIELQKDIVLMLEVFCACIENKIIPAKDSPCYKTCRELIDKSGIKFKRERSYSQSFISPSKIHTIELQEEKIRELIDKNKQLESGYRQLCKINKQLRDEHDKALKSENKLTKVNI